MSSRSSFLPRLRLGRPEEEGLLLYNSTKLPDRGGHSDYNLSELSPRPEDAFLPSNMASIRDRKNPPSPHSPHSPSSPLGLASNKTSSTGSDSKFKPRALFPGPPPPIATSILVTRDEEDGPIGHTSIPRNRSANRSLTKSALSSVSSVLFDRGAPSRDDDASQAYEPDTIWRNLQRRERTLQKELQGLLDAQSAGLAANLDPNASSPPSNLSERSEVSSDNGTTRGTTLYSDDGGSSSGVPRTGSRSSRRHVSFDTGSPTRSTPGGGVVPVRQPRRKRMGLGEARAGLRRRMSLLADLKAEEDERLDEALSIRKKALSHLQRLVTRRDGIVGELRLLEQDEEEPLARTLRELGDERDAVAEEMRELEQRLLSLRGRKKRLDGRIDDLKNRRDAGLSGYKGALREVEVKVSGLLRKPPIKPLDPEVISRSTGSPHGMDSAGVGSASTGGVEFARMLPERRTADMARDWWENEVRLLEMRREEVTKERTALEKGAEVWQESVQLVTKFESELQREMRGDPIVEGKGKQTVPTPEESMRALLGKMAGVMAGLEERLQIAEAEGWNLLTCAIGAELEAFREARGMLRETLRASGFDDDGSPTPKLGRSMNGVTPPARRYEPGPGNDQVHVEDKTAESDNEVPPDLLVAHEEDHSDSFAPSSPRAEHRVASVDHGLDDSENEVPPEFLAQHHDGD